MADLYFKVNADYEELVRMQQEADRLKNELVEASSKADFTRLTNELGTLQDKMRELAENGARNFIDKFKEMDDGTPDFFKGFDSAFATFSSNAVGHFDTMKQQYIAMMNELLDKADELERNGNAPKMLEQVRDLTDEIEKQIAVCERGKEIWSGMYDAASVDALDIVKEQRAEEEKKLAVMEQELETLRQQAEASKMTFGDKLGASIAGGSLTSLLGAEDPYKKQEETQAALEQATQAYEAQKQVVAELRAEEESLSGQLSATAQAQVEEATAAEQATTDRQAYIEKLRETQGEASKTTDVLDELLGRGDAAAKDLNLDILKNDITSAEEKLKELGDELREDIGFWKEAQRELTQMENDLMSNGASSQYNPEDIEAARAKVEEMRQGVLDTADAYNRVNADVQTYKQQLDEASGHQVRMRTQIMNAREEMMRMIAAGQQGTPMFQQLAVKAGEMRRQMNLANATMQYFANPTRHLAAMKTGLQGVAGAAGLVTGAMGLFNNESKKMQEIQTKVQSILSIIVGLETTYNTIKQSSTFMLAIQEIKTWALAGARTSEATATEAATVAQEGLNVAMAANPIGAVIAVVVALGAAIYGLVQAFSDVSEEEAYAKSVSEEFEKQMQTQSQTLTKQITTFYDLQKRYNECGNDTKKLTKFVNENADAFKILREKVKNANDAHRLFGNNSPAYIEAARNRAIALAQEATNAALLAKTLAKLSEIYRKFLAGEEVNYDDVRDAISEATGLGKAKAGQMMMKYGIKRENEWFGKANAIVDESSDFAGMMTEVVTMQMKQNKEIFDKMMGKLHSQTSKAGLKEEKNMENYSEDKPTKTKNKKKGKEKKGTKKSTGAKSSPEDDAWRKEEERLEDERTKRESERKFELDYARRLEQEKINLMNEGAAKKMRQAELNHKKEKDAIEERYRQIILLTIANEKKLFDEQEESNKKKIKGYKKKHYYESDQYKKHFTGQNPVSGELILPDEYKDYKEAEVGLSDMNFEKERIKMYRDYLAQSEKYYDELFKIEMNYYNEREKLKDDLEVGYLSPSEYNNAVAELEKKLDKEKRAYELNEFKASPLYASAMADGLVDSDTIEEFKTQMERLMNEAAKEMNPTDFKAFADLYNKLSDKLIETDPFGSLKASIEEYKKAQEDVVVAEEELAKVRTKYYGRTKENSTSLIDQLKAERDEAYEIWTGWNESLRSLPQDGSVDEKELENRRQKEANALAYLNSVEGKYKAALDDVKRAEQGVINAHVKKNNTNKKLNKSIKKSTELVGELANAFAGLASEVSQPIGQLLSGVGNLIMSTVDGIEKIHQASEKTTDGLKKVGQAVTKAVAILAIIQAAWQVINTIMELVQGEDIAQKEIDILEAKIKALDYQFNKLKEDMDKAWGTEAIDAYARAVDSLMEKQKTSMEVIQAKASKSKDGFMGIGGYHSLEYQMNKIIGSNSLGGITNAELEAAKKVLQSLGVDTSKGNLLDWIYQLSPENMATFLSSVAGNAVVAKLAAVTSSGDYQGSDWLSDLQSYADTAKSAEDITLEMAEKLNGISLDGLKDEFKTLVTTMTTSLNDINNSFDAFMREAMYNKLRDKYEEQVESFNEELKDLNDQYTRGEMSDEEYRKRLQALREKWKKETREAQDEYQAQLTAAGINAEDVEQSSTSGGFEAMSEDTATELNGRFAAMQAMETVTAENTLQMVGLQTNIANIADEIRTIQVNALLELQEISENTKKIYNTVGEMQGDVKTIKDNTDRL